MLAAVSYGPAGSFSVCRPERAQCQRLAAEGQRWYRVAAIPAGWQGHVCGRHGGIAVCVLMDQARVIANLPLAVRPDNLCFNEDGGQLFITGEGRDAVVVIFPYYVPQVAETVLAGHAPAAMAASSTAPVPRESAGRRCDASRYRPAEDRGRRRRSAPIPGISPLRRITTTRWC